MVNLWREMLKNSIVLFCFNLRTYNFSIWLYEKPQIFHFYDFGMFERVLGPRSQLVLYLETPGYFKEFRKKQLNSKQYFVEKYFVWRYSFVGRRKTTSHLMKYWKTWRWNQYLPKEWNGKLVICDQWIFETLKGRNQETLKPRNQ